jgi:glycosyltransferase involved in cell wall biosynthesis
MIGNKRLIVVMPAYNAEKTLEMTYGDLPHEYVDDVILVDDSSSDQTAAFSRKLGIHTIVHRENKGYGGNQKSCYREALRLGADVVVMLHPDYQYSPRLVGAMAILVTSGHYDVALGSRIIGGQSLRGGMPLYKYLANRFLTFVQNIGIQAKLSEYHTGYRAFSREVLERLPLEENSDDFVFDNEMLAQAHYFGFSIGEISCPTRYFEDASSINFTRSVQYGLGVLATTLKFILARLDLWTAPIFRADGRRLEVEPSNATGED